MASLRLVFIFCLCPGYFGRDPISEDPDFNLDSGLDFGHSSNDQPQLKTSDAEFEPTTSGLYSMTLPQDNEAVNLWIDKIKTTPRKLTIRTKRRQYHTKLLAIKPSMLKRKDDFWSDKGYRLGLYRQCLLVKRHVNTTHSLMKMEEVKAPNFPDSITSGDVKLIKKEGDPVAMDEVVMEIETDKTALPVMSPGNGTVAKILVKEGEAVKSQQPLFQINVTGVAPPKAAAPAAAAPASAAVKPAAAPAPAPAPAARPPTPAPAKVAVAKGAKAPAGPTLSSLRIADPTKAISGSRTEHPVPMNKMRKRISERLKEAQNTTAMLTTFNECDMSKLMAFRKANQDKFTKKYGVKLSLMSPFLRASANALQDQPVVNAVIVGDDIRYRDYVDISVAVATPRGLVVPVLRNVESMDYPRIELAMGEIAAKARTGKLTPADMQGGTFTISNGGVFGSLMSMPIINLPQSAILGMHAIFQRPVAIGGKVEIRPMMYLALTYDHRLIDGREAVRFLLQVKSGVEDPTSILAGI